MAKNKVNKVETDDPKSVRQDKRERYTQQQVADALFSAGGIQTEAARILGCTKTTLNGYVMRYPYLQEVLHQAKEDKLDLAESKLFEKIESGNMTAIIFFLKCQGKQRGYVEKGETAHKAPEAAAVDLSTMSNEDLKQLETILGTAANTGKPTRFDA
jgi:hypothetical protein